MSELEVDKCVVALAKKLSFRQNLLEAQKYAKEVRARKPEMQVRRLSCPTS